MKNLFESRDFLTLEFNFKFPMDFNTFLAERANVIKSNHPDKGSRCSSEKFTLLINSLNTVKDNFDEINGFIDSLPSDAARVQTGELISNLGHGLGSTTNGIKCTGCFGKGYNVIEIPVYQTIYDNCDCEEGFVYSASCRSCNGTGIFHTKSGFDVKCKSCNGTKVHQYKTPRKCPKCNNRSFNFFSRLFGYEKIVGSKRQYHKCYKCNGIGELEILNPVFQKGSMNLSSKTKSESKVNSDSAKILTRFNKIMSKI